MKSLVFLTSVIAVAIAQRPGYLGSGPVGYPGLASRFKDESSTAASSTADFPNRLGESGGTTSKIPVDARGDIALVNRLNQWPREHRPFWILNAEHIEAQRGGPQPQNQAAFPSRGSFDEAFDDFGNPMQTRTIRPIQTRGSFAGSLPQ